MIRKYNKLLFFAILVWSVFSLNAKPISPALAKQVAENFFNKNAVTKNNQAVLNYTKLSSNGNPVYYAFTIGNGFVVISGDDALKPIIGYSNQGIFKTPEKNTTIAYWMKQYEDILDKANSNDISADETTKQEWVKYTTNAANTTSQKTISHNTTASTVAPLVQTTWDQWAGYNTLCPGSSPTGCIATAMAQIMKYWNYPSQGTGSSSYCDCVSNNYANDYGTLSANYGATTYNWANMPINSGNSDVALLMYDLGISVGMNYDINGSGAWMITSEAESPICSQISFVTYFKYNPYTIQGLVRTSYTDNEWIQLLINELLNNRPIQYAGNDPSTGEGHSWVSDGVDTNNYFHMNWGWSGSDNGYYSINNFNLGFYNPSIKHEALIGIVPMTITTDLAGITSISNPVFGCNDTILNPFIALQNQGNNALTSCSINYSIDNGALQTYTWSGNLASTQTISVTLPAINVTAVGSHTFTCYAFNPNNNTVASFNNSQASVVFYIGASSSQALAEGFETSSTLPNAIWNVSHSSTTGGTDFQITSSSAATGAQSAMIDNSTNTAGNNSYLQTIYSYDMTGYTSPVLSFKAAYQQKSSTNTDKLQVFTSTNCGASWISRRNITSSALAVLSGGASSSPYIPTPSQYTTYTVNIIPVASSHQVMFRWAFIADPSSPGNNLYIDDINITNASSGIATIENDINTITLYPNPSTGIENVELNLSQQQNISVTVTNLLGQIIEVMPTKQYQSGINNITLGSAQKYPSGIYMVNINIDGQTITKKIVII